MVSDRRIDHLVIVQPTPFCNIDCRYCYLPNRLDVRRMSVQTFEEVVKKIVEAGLFEDGFTVCWHAGEPLVMPIDFYEQCAEVTRRYDSPAFRIKHNIQSNLTLLTDQWCQFFKRNPVFSLGVSVDGPAFLHDKNRVDRSGRGTFARVQEALRLLTSSGVPFSIICVLTSDHLSHPLELYTFLASTGADGVSFNVEEIEGIHHDSTLFSGAGEVDEFKKFMRELLRLNDQSTTPIKFRRCEYDLLAMPGEPINDLVTPWATLTVDFQGNVSTFCPELMGTPEPRFANFIFGNLLEQSFSEIRQSTAFRALEAEVASGVSRCREECEYFKWCGGGTPSNKYFEHGRLDVAETSECRFMKKAILDVNLERLESKLAAIASTAKAHH